MNLILFFLAIFSLSQAANLAKLAAAPPEVLGFWRLLAAALVMLTVALLNKKFVSHIKTLKGRYGIQALFSGLFLFLHLWTYKFGAQHTSIANAMILFASNPLITAFITILIFKEPFDKKLIIAYTLAFIGIYVLLNHNLKFDPQNFPGDLSALASAGFYSAYILTGRQARKHISNTTYSYFIYAIAAICFLSLALIKQTPLTGYSSITWISIAGLIIFPTLLGHALFSYLLKHIDINWLSTGKLIEPALASLGAFFLFHEYWKEDTLFAFILTSCSILILIEPWKRLRRKTLK